ncbi:MAG: isochorismatase family protein [Phycisphaeraceae bacterium]|nr:isochorismatase family protein [Phycisphaeraceae bacterium]
MPVPRIQSESSLALVIDLQQKLLPHMEAAEGIASQAVRLIRGCATLSVPLLVTEQYPAGLGPTVDPVSEAMGDLHRPVAKTCFSAWIDPIRESVEASGRTTVILMGIETHVCLLQTALDLASAGYLPVVAADATGSRRSVDSQVALDRIAGFGLISTVESILLEMVKNADNEAFKAILPLIR